MFSPSPAGLESLYSCPRISPRRCVPHPLAGSRLTFWPWQVEAFQPPIPPVPRRQNGHQTQFLFPRLGLPCDEESGTSSQKEQSACQPVPCQFPGAKNATIATSIRNKTVATCLAQLPASRSQGRSRGMCNLVTGGVLKAQREPQLLQVSLGDTEIRVMSPDLATTTC